jgi:hypothetical protein
VLACDGEHHITHIAAGLAGYDDDPRGVLAAWAGAHRFG